MELIGGERRGTLTRVPLENGSFSTESCVQYLHLHRLPSTRDAKFQVSTLTLLKATNDFSTATLLKSIWSYLMYLSITVWNYAEPVQIEILIGISEMYEFLLSELRKGSSGTNVYIGMGRAGL